MPRLRISKIGLTKTTIGKNYKHSKKDDPSEKENLTAKYPEKVEELTVILRNIITNGRSTEDENQTTENQTAKKWNKLNLIFPELLK